MQALLDKLSDSYDILILDTPPLLAASDAAIISRSVDGAIVVVNAEQRQLFALLGEPLTGIVHGGEMLGFQALKSRVLPARTGGVGESAGTHHRCETPEAHTP